MDRRIVVGVSPARTGTGRAQDKELQPGPARDCVHGPLATAPARASYRLKLAAARFRGWLNRAHRGRSPDRDHGRGAPMGPRTHRGRATCCRSRNGRVGISLSRRVESVAADAPSGKVRRRFTTSAPATWVENRALTPAPRSWLHFSKRRLPEVPNVAGGRIVIDSDRRKVEVKQAGPRRGNQPQRQRDTRENEVHAMSPVVASLVRVE
jgi:hypothetical protein